MRVGKCGWIAKTLAALLALTFAGCQAAPQQLSREEAPQRLVVANRQENASLAYAPESPSINYTVALPGDVPTVQTVATSSADPVKGVWISYLEMAELLGNKTEKQFTANIGSAFDNVKDFGLNTVIVQVRPFGDALYDSEYFPWSYTITGTEGKDPGFDPLAIMVREAKDRGLRIEAWLNPYRIRANGNKNAISKNSQAGKWIAEGSGAVITYDGTTSFNPASKAARELIVNGAAEIARNYDVDGIHIDDYFYPTDSAAFDKNTYSAYQKNGGELALADWRRSNVETLVKEMYAAIKAADKNVKFGISPQSSVYNNYNAQYLDVEKIISKGYCDYMCPQIYFGYENDAQPYQKTLDQWSKMVSGTNVKLYIGLAVYKIGALDSYAGGGKNEWLENDDLMERMVLDAREANNYGGFFLYRYDSVFKPAAKVKAAVQKENKNLKSIL